MSSAETINPGEKPDETQVTPSLESTLQATPSQATPSQGSATQATALPTEPIATEPPVTEPPTTPLPPSAYLEESLRIAKAAARSAAENRGQDIVVLDISKQTSLFDCFVIVTGTSRRQLHAMAEEIARILKHDLHEKRLSMSGYSESRWIVLDYGGVVIHLFDEEARAFYDLEGLWADGIQVDLTEALRNTGATMSKQHP